MTPFRLDVNEEGMTTLFMNGQPVGLVQRFSFSAVAADMVPKAEMTYVLYNQTEEEFRERFSPPPWIKLNAVTVEEYAEQKPDETTAFKDADVKLVRFESRRMIKRVPNEETGGWSFVDEGESYSRLTIRVNGKDIPLILDGVEMLHILRALCTEGAHFPEVPPLESVPKHARAIAYEKTIPEAIPAEGSSFSDWAPYGPTEEKK